MLFAHRLTALRVVTLVAVVASALLVVDSVSPGREFCPLEEACSAAAQSELGSLFGIPTSILGLGAFAFVLLATLLPVRAARAILQPACFVGAIAAMALIAYQAMYLENFCPLCLVADGAAIVMGYIALTWPPLPILRSGRRLSAETPAARMAWGLAVVLAVVAPFAWPHAEDPGWEDAPEVADALFEDDAAADPLTPEGEATAATAPTKPAIAATAVPPEKKAPKHKRLPTAAPLAVEAPAQKPASPDIEAVAMPTPAEPAVAETPVPPAPKAPEVRPTEAPVAPKVATPTPAPTQEPAVRVIEYLNAFCKHCRATHARLEEVLEKDNVRIERRRVYTWKGRGYPLWARACAYAQTIGREDDMFRELTRARRETAGEVYAAAQRAGIDSPAFREALLRSEPPPRLVRDKRIAKAARLKRLPTFDIGRRRLSGSQSEGELRAALQAAARARTPANG